MRVRAPFRRSIASRGRKIYQQKIRHLVEPHEKGRIVVIDINSGDYEIADRDAEASVRLRERRPDAITWADFAFDGLRSGVLADGSYFETEAYTADILWQDQRIRASICWGCTCSGISG